MSDIKIAPSILSADFGRLNEDIATIEEHADWLHIDVMDGHFVPNLTFGAPVMKYLKTSLFKDYHLMVDNPEKLFKDFVAAGADAITIHATAAVNLPEIIKIIQSYGVKAGVALKPATPLSEIESVIDFIDLVLIMTVEPGFGGQAFMEEPLEKIRALRKRKPDLDISTDGGINPRTAELAIAAGANILVAGSAIFNSTDRAKTIEALRG